MQHYCWWNKYVANPIRKEGYQGKGRTAMRVLKEEILPAILLRRTKVQCADVLALPPRCAAATSAPAPASIGPPWCHAVSHIIPCLAVIVLLASIPSSLSNVVF